MPKNAKPSYVAEFKNFASCPIEEPKGGHTSSFNGRERVGAVTLYMLEYDGKITLLKTWKSYIVVPTIDFDTGLMTFRHLELGADDPGPFGTPQSYWFFVDKQAYISRAAALAAAHKSICMELKQLQAKSKELKQQLKLGT